jgi:hypothetical protein
MDLNLNTKTSPWIDSNTQHHVAVKLLKKKTRSTKHVRGLPSTVTKEKEKKTNRRDPHENTSRWTRTGLGLTTTTTTQLAPSISHSVTIPSLIF